MDGLRLTAGDATASLDTLGGRLAGLTVRGHDLLAPVTSTRLQAGCYPLVPWAGRLGHGRFRFDGAVHQMPPTMGPHAIHGLATDAEWQVTDDGEMELSLDDRWPFGGTTTVSYRLSADAIACTLTVTAGTSAMPAVLGWHPCFVRTLVGNPDRLDFDPAFMWPRGDDYLPRGDQAPVSSGPWDDCFGGVSEPPRVAWGDVLAVTLRSPTSTWVVFDELGTIVCVEPQTAPPDAFNLGGAATLGPGESLTLPLEISW